MLTVVKRSGKHSEDKIKSSLAATSDEVGNPFTEGDLNLIARELNRLLAEKTQVPSRDIRMMVCGILYSYGFKGVLEAYVKEVA